jgi:beta-glucosidase
MIEMTESGTRCNDAPFAADQFLQAHLTELTRAIRDGANERGYQAWNLLDNLE